MLLENTTRLLLDKQADSVLSSHSRVVAHPTGSHGSSQSHSLIIFSFSYVPCALYFWRLPMQHYALPLYCPPESLPFWMILHFCKRWMKQEEKLIKKARHELLRTRRIICNTAVALYRRLTAKKNQKKVTWREFAVALQHVTRHTGQCQSMSKDMDERTDEYIPREW